MVLSCVLCLFLFCIRIPPGCCSTAQTIKPWLLLPRLGYLTGLAKICPGLTLTILLFSSRLPFPTVWTLTSALLISVLSINVTPLIILHLGLSLVNWCDKTLTILDIYDYLISDKSNQSYIKNCPGYTKHYHCSGWVFLLHSPKHFK